MERDRDEKHGHGLEDAESNLQEPLKEASEVTGSVQGIASKFVGGGKKRSNESTTGKGSLPKKLRRDFVTERHLATNDSKNERIYSKCPNCSKKLFGSSKEKWRHVHDCVYKSNARELQGGTEPIRTEKEPSTATNEPKFHQSTRKLHGKMASHMQFRSSEVDPDFSKTFNQLTEPLNDRLQHELNNKGELKAQLTASVLLRKKDPLYESATEEVFYDKVQHINAKMMVLHPGEDLDETISNWKNTIQSNLDSMTEEESGYSILDLISFQLETYKISPLASGIYQPLPTTISRRYVLAIHNLTDPYCILYAIAIHLTLMRTTQTKASWAFSWTSMQTHPLKDGIYETFNNLLSRCKNKWPLNLQTQGLNGFYANLGISDMNLGIYTYDKEQIHCLYYKEGPDYEESLQLTDQQAYEEYEKHSIDILIFNQSSKNPKELMENGHAALITDLSSLIRYKRNRSHAKTYLCRYRKASSHLYKWLSRSLAH